MGKRNNETLKFIYNKTSSYRTYNVEGVFGGLSPKNKIFIEFFNEKLPVPESVVHEVTEDGILGKEIEKKAFKGIIREIECGIYLDIPTAIAFSNWLEARIKQFKETTKENN